MHEGIRGRRAEAEVFPDIAKQDPVRVGLVADVELIVINLELVRLRVLRQRAARRRAKLIERREDIGHRLHVLLRKIIHRITAIAVVQLCRIFIFTHRHTSTISKEMPLKSVMPPAPYPPTLTLRKRLTQRVSAR